MQTFNWQRKSAAMSQTNAIISLPFAKFHLYQLCIKWILRCNSFFSFKFLSPRSTFLGMMQIRLECRLPNSKSVFKSNLNLQEFYPIPLFSSLATFTCWRMRISYKKRFSLVDSSRPASSFFATKSISLNVQTCGGETIKIENRFLTLRENKSSNKITLLFAANKLQTKFILITGQRGWVLLGEVERSKASNQLWCN